MAGPFETWSDEVLLHRVRAAADRCVEVVSLPEEQRHRIGAKGEASPEQAGTFSAVVVFHMMQEVRKRGLDQ